jgi:hypothetical protein
LVAAVLEAGALLVGALVGGLASISKSPSGDPETLLSGGAAVELLMPAFGEAGNRAEFAVGSLGCGAPG